MPLNRHGLADEQIADWLNQLGMSEYAQRFAENRIDFSVLPDLTDQHLKDLGIALGDITFGSTATRWAAARCFVQPFNTSDVFVLYLYGGSAKSRKSADIISPAPEIGFNEVKMPIHGGASFVRWPAIDSRNLNQLRSLTRECQEE